MEGLKLAAKGSGTPSGRLPAGFVPSKWETIDPEEVQAQAVTSKWDIFDQVSLLRKMEVCWVCVCVLIFTMAYVVGGHDLQIKMKKMGCDCGSVGREVASYTRDLQFESQHRQSLIYQL